jgi:membrane protein
VLPGFEGVPFATVMKLFLDSLINGIIFQRAAAMTYRIFVSIIPIFMALFAAISFLDLSVRTQIMNTIQNVVPGYTWPAIRDMIEGVVLIQNGVLLYTSFATGLFMTVLCVNSIITSLNITYFKIPARGILQQLGVSFLLTLTFGAIILVAIGISIGATYAIRHIHFLTSPLFATWTIKVAQWVLLLILIYSLLSVLFYFAPVNKKYFRLFSVGSTFSTLMLVILLYALNLYFYYFPTYNMIYGTIGALFAVLIWLYWSSFLVLFGFDLNVSIYAARHKKSEKKL